MTSKQRYIINFLQRKILLRKFCGNTIAMSDEIKSFAKESEIPISESIRILFTEYVAKVFEVSYPETDLVDQEDLDQAKAPRDAARIAGGIPRNVERNREEEAERLFRRIQPAAFNNQWIAINDQEPQ